MRGRALRSPFNLGIKWARAPRWPTFASCTCHLHRRGGFYCAQLCPSAAMSSTRLILPCNTFAAQLADGEQPAERHLS